MALKPGKTLSHYRLVEEIGKGGMGVVWKALDTELDRHVAIKILPPELTADAERRVRFKREGRAAAALNHPNIATVFEAGETAEATFIVMEMIEGKTLRSLIRGKPLPMPDALRFAVEIAEGLACAHRARVIHRDLKPDNIIVRPDQHPRILDFGLAKLLEEREDLQRSQLSHADTLTGELTREGKLLGTAAYMSPEQARGKAVDSRSDIFSFGVMLYEMITGQRPFRGETHMDTLAAILNKPATPPSHLNSEVPPELERILGKCLEKDVNARYQHTDELVVDLQKLKSMAEASGVGPLVISRALGRRAPLIASLAVLPLRNVSGDPKQEHLADGMTETLIGELGRISALRVISRTSATRYKDTDKSVPEIARELNVDAIVEGSVFRANGRVRVHVQLIQGVPEERQLWSQAYDRELSDVLSMHGDVARDVAGRLEIKMTPEEETRLGSARRVNPETYELYLKGMHQIGKGTPEGFEAGLSYLNEAIDKDPADPLAYAWLALGYTIVGHDPRPPSQALPRAKAAALTALKLDESLAEAHVALADVKIYYDWDLAGAERSFRRALELNPSLALARGHYAWFLTLFGRYDEALAEQKQAQNLDPLHPIFTGWLGWMYLWVERYDDAIIEARKSLELHPDFPMGHYVLGTAYGEKGMYEESIAAHKKAGAASPGWRWGLGVTLALAGRDDEARMLLDELEKEVYQWDTWGLAEVYATLGDKDGAFSWLQAAYDQRHSYIPWLNEFPAFKPLRDDPRFQELLGRIDFPE